MLMPPCRMQATHARLCLAATCMLPQPPVRLLPLSAAAAAAGAVFRGSARTRRLLRDCPQLRVLETPCMIRHTMHDGQVAAAAAAGVSAAAAAVCAARARLRPRAMQSARHLRLPLHGSVSQTLAEMPCLCTRARQGRLRTLSCCSALLCSALLCDSMPETLSCLRVSTSFFIFSVGLLTLFREGTCRVLTNVTSCTCVVESLGAFLGSSQVSDAKRHPVCIERPELGCAHNSSSMCLFCASFR